jgi:hypothetical protein
VVFPSLLHPQQWESSHRRILYETIYTGINNGNPDAPRVYSNAGTLLTTMSGLACTTNCDPFDIVELPDGRFVVSYQIAAANSLELFDSSFVRVGTLYSNPAVLMTPSALEVLENGDLLACSQAYNTCERFAISGNLATRVGDRAFISNTSLVRQATKVIRVP